MKINFNEKLNLLKNDFKFLLNFHKSKVPTFHNSNIFFRDLQYSVKRFIESKQINCTYEEANKLTLKIIEYLEQETILVKVNDTGYRLNYLPFLTCASPTHEFENK